MDFARKALAMKRNASCLQMSLLVLSFLLVTMTSSSPLPARRPSVTSDSWFITSEGSGRSHLVMWMRTEKQLIPRIARLAESARELLTFTCQQENQMEWEECLEFALSLPNITGLDDVPSHKVLQSEKKKTFVKMLVENAYVSLEELWALFSHYVYVNLPSQCGADDACRSAQHFKRSLDIALDQFKDTMMSFYKSKPTATPGQVKVKTEDFSNDNQVAIKVLEVAVNRLNQIHSVLEYSVELSWFSRLDNVYRGSRGAGKRRNKKSKKSKKSKKNP